jgi:hypothetical protein
MPIPDDAPRAGYRRRWRPPRGTARGGLKGHGRTHDEDHAGGARAEFCVGPMASERARAMCRDIDMLTIDGSHPLDARRRKVDRRDGVDPHAATASRRAHPLAEPLRSSRGNDRGWRDGVGQVSRCGRRARGDRDCRDTIARAGGHSVSTNTDRGGRLTSARPRPREAIPLWPLRCRPFRAARTGHLSTRPRIGWSCHRRWSR